MCMQMKAPAVFSWGAVYLGFIMPRKAVQQILKCTIRIPVVPFVFLMV